MACLHEIGNTVMDDGTTNSSGFTRLKVVAIYARKYHWADAWQYENDFVDKEASKPYYRRFEKKRRNA